MKHPEDSTSNEELTRKAEAAWENYRDVQIRAFGRRRRQMRKRDYINGYVHGHFIGHQVGAES